MADHARYLLVAFDVPPPGAAVVNMSSCDGTARTADGPLGFGCSHSCTVLVRGV